MFREGSNDVDVHDVHEADRQIHVLIIPRRIEVSDAADVSDEALSLSVLVSAGLIMMSLNAGIEDHSVIYQPKHRNQDWERIPSMCSRSSWGSRNATIPFHLLGRSQLVLPRDDVKLGLLGFGCCVISDRRSGITNECRVSCFPGPEKCVGVTGQVLSR